MKAKEIPGVFYNDPAMSPEDIKDVCILREDDCMRAWTEYVSSTSRHFMTMHNDEWPYRIVSDNPCWYHWKNDWDNDNFSDFRSLLQTINIPTQSQVLVFWMKEVGIETSWQVFLNNWGNFLYEDEGCIVVFPKHDESLVLSNGAAWLGKRCKK